MPKIHPGHEVLSLFGMAPHQSALNHVVASKSLAATLISAFFIVLVLGAILALSTGSFTFSLPQLAPSTSASSINSGEPVAFEPSRAVSQQISQGYLMP